MLILHLKLLLVLLYIFTLFFIVFNVINLSSINNTMKGATKCMKRAKESLLSKLLRNNSGYSSKSFFLVAITMIGLLLLLVPVFVLVIEAWYNHTIQTNLSDMAAYIASVAAIFASGGITKAWSERYERRAGQDGILGTEDDIFVKRDMYDVGERQEHEKENKEEH